VHDVPELYTWRYRLSHHRLQVILSRSAQQILSVSEFSRRITADYAVLTHHGLWPKRYILCVGNDTPNKNIAAVIRAFRTANPLHVQLVHAGARDDRVFRKSGERAAAMRLDFASSSELRSAFR
jgi:glycosyltransferase involved in cell wall biosynthesis